MMKKQYKIKIKIGKFIEYDIDNNYFQLEKESNNL